MRVGIGYDVHRLVEGRKLMLGGVEIPHTMGLLGHSDADVLVHAVMDALLGAAALGDIGRHFPDSAPCYKGVSSIELLGKVLEMITDSGCVIVNIDSTICAQKPKLAAFVEGMVYNISKVLKINTNQINIKATTTESLGFEGREEGISAYAVCCLEEKQR